MTHVSFIEVRYMSQMALNSHNTNTPNTRLETRNIQQIPLFVADLVPKSVALVYIVQLKYVNCTITSSFNSQVQYIKCIINQ